MAATERSVILRLLRESAPIAEIARGLGRSRQTISNWRNATEEDGEKPHRASKLDAFMAFIESRLESFDLQATVLVRELVARGCTGGITVAGISQAALEGLQGYSWPGKVRQLERERARVVLLVEDGDAAETGHLSERLRPGYHGVAEGSQGEVMDDAERRAILAALGDYGGDAGAAQVLEIGRSIR